MATYEHIIVEVFLPEYTEPTSANRRIRPAKGQKYPQSLRVECDRSFREEYPVGTQFRMQVKLVESDEMSPFLYSHYKWKPELIKK
jgi:hypothetical protein